MCTKKCFRMPTLVIFGVILTIVLVFITGITLTNSINISNIVKLREKVASDSAAANSANAAQTRAALVEQQYSTLQQHHLSRSDLNYITANHPKNLQRFLQPQQQQTEIQQQQLAQPSPQTPLQHLPLQSHGNQPIVGSSSTANNNNNNNNNKIIIEIGIRNFTAAAAAAVVAHQQQQQQQQLLQTNNRSLSSTSSLSSSSSFDSNRATALEKNIGSATGAATIVEQLVAPFDGAIIDGNIESISVPATSEIRQQLNETLKYLAENDKTVTSLESKNSLMLNRLPPLNTGSLNISNSSSNVTLKLLNFPNITNATVISTSSSTSSNLTANATLNSSSSPTSSSSPSSSSLVVNSLKSFLNNSLNSLTSSNNNNATVSKETILFSILSTTTSAPASPASSSSSSLPPVTASVATSTTISPAILLTSAANQLSIEDHNPGMIDFEKRNYVKKVKIIFGFLLPAL